MKAQIKKDDSEALAKMKAEGVEVITWPKDEIAKLRTFTAEVQDSLAPKSPIARKVVESHRAFQKKIG